jgi:hypothetical protein
MRTKLKSYAGSTEEAAIVAATGHREVTCDYRWVRMGPRLPHHSSSAGDILWPEQEAPATTLFKSHQGLLAAIRIRLGAFCKAVTQLNSDCMDLFAGIYFVTSTGS